MLFVSLQFAVEEDVKAQQFIIRDQSELWNGGQDDVTTAILEITFPDGTLHTFNLMTIWSAMWGNQGIGHVSASAFGLTTFEDGYYTFKMTVNDGDHPEGTEPHYTAGSVFLAKHTQRYQYAPLKISLTDDYMTVRELFLLGMYFQTAKIMAERLESVRANEIIQLMDALFDKYEIEEP